MAPKVSIVVPVYNVERYLKECLDSIRSQSLKDIEVVVVDDGSTDDSGAIADSYAKEDPRFKVIHKPNSGYGHTMNTGFRAATGEYVGIVESDDCARPRMFEKLYALGVKNDADVVRSNYYAMSGNGSRFDFIDILSLGSAPYGRSFNPADYVEILRGSPAIWSGVYKASYLRDHDIEFLETPGASYQDTGFFLKVISLADRVVFTREAFLNYRVDNAGSSVKSGAKVFCVSDEYRSFESVLSGYPEKEKAFEKIIPAKKWETYIWNFNRLDDSLKNDFLRLMTSEFSDYRERQMLDKSLFSEEEWKEVQRVVNDPDSIGAGSLTVVDHASHRLNHRLSVLYNKVVK